MNLLSIGGSDPSGGAGIQSDITNFWTKRCSLANGNYGDN